MCGVSYMPACISLLLDIRRPARPGVPPSWCAGGEKLFSIFYGAYYLHKCAEGVDTSFNSEMSGKLFGLWCEIQVTPDTAQALKNMLKSKTFEKHGKSKDIKARSC